MAALTGQLAAQHAHAPSPDQASVISELQHEVRHLHKQLKDSAGWETAQQEVSQQAQARAETLQVKLDAALAEVHRLQQTSQEHHAAVKQPANSATGPEPQQEHGDGSGASTAGDMAELLFRGEAASQQAQESSLLKQQLQAALQVSICPGCDILSTVSDAGSYIRHRCLTWFSLLLYSTEPASSSDAMPRCLGAQ